MTAAGAKRSGSGGAGRRGEKIRSDLWVAVKPRNSGGIEIDLESRVEPYYGDDHAVACFNVQQVQRDTADLQARYQRYKGGAAQ